MGIKDRNQDQELVKITFAGNPPRMHFALTRLNNGVNITDMQNYEISALGSGELSKIVTDAGEALRRTLEATLNAMSANQSIEVIILVNPNPSFAFVGPGKTIKNQNALQAINFALMGQDDDDSVHILKGKKSTGKDDNVLDKKTIIIVQGHKGIVTDLDQDLNIKGSSNAVIIDPDDLDNGDDDDLHQ